MNLNTSLMIIGQRFGFNIDNLKLDAMSDTLGGYSPDEALRKWPMGSLFAVEGQTLFALVRALQPLRVLEIGTHRGASATHIAAALKRDDNEGNNGAKLTGCDLGDYGGDLILDYLRPYIEILHVNGIDYLADQPDNTFGLIFEDASHDAETTAAVAQLAMRKLAPGGVLAVHDAAHFLVGKDIRAGLDAANLPGGYGVYLCEPSDCGLAIWRKALPAPDVVPDAEELAELRQGHEVEVTPSQTKIVRKHAPDKITRTRKKAVH